MPIRLTIHDMQSIAADYGGKCLSKEYINSSQQLAWMCSKGHTWDSSYSIVQQGGWCRQCAQNEEFLIKLDEIAEKKGGKCLSENYTNSLTKLKFQCAAGHTFLMSPRNVLTGSWCLQCYRNEEREKAFRKLKKIAERKGGKCLSSIYKSKQSTLKWQCKNGHTWTAQALQISKGCWCKECSRNEICEKELKKLKVLAQKKGGKCLSDRFTRTDKKLKWQCSEGHVFSVEPHSVKAGRWCRICGRKTASQKIWKYSFDDVKQYAKKNGGIILSTKYDPMKPLKWQCKEGHVWTAVARPVLDKGTWCFKCYMETTKLPIEEFQKIAKERGGKLLSQKYINSATRLKWGCKEGHVWMSTPYIIKQGSWCLTCSYENRKPTIEVFKEIAKKHGGKLLSDKYVDSETKLKWQCKNGHTWMTTPHIIQRGSWCRQCINESQKLSLKEFQEIAKSRGGKLLSNTYKGTNTHLKWQCAEGHIWSTDPSVIKKGSWCRKCSTAKRKLTIDVFQKIAKLRGGKLLSDKYINSNTPLKWECKEGHTWMTTPIIVKQGSWCPVCAYKRK